MDPEVPLVVPEVNADALRHIPKGIVANPNCSTIQMVVALKPLHDLAQIKRVVVATYQASSGKGATGLLELDAQMAAIGRNEAGRRRPRRTPPSWPATSCRTTGRPATTATPRKNGRWSARRTRSWATTPSQVSPTTVRVPVRIGHSEAINLEFHNPITPEQAREALRRAPGVVVLDDQQGRGAAAADAVGRDEVFVGRIRRDPTVPHGLNLWVVADNLRKGAATNAVQIAEVLVQRGWLPRNENIERTRTQRHREK